MKLFKITLAILSMTLFFSCSSTRNYPVVFVPDAYYCFSSVPPVIKFSISPYLIDKNSISAKIIENDMIIHCQPLLNDMEKLVDGNIIEYQGYLSSNLEPGQYNVKIQHRIKDEFYTTNVPLLIFEPKLTNAKDLNTRLGYLTLYGYTISDLNFEAPNGAIPPNQFRIKLMTNNNQKRPPIAGLSIPREKGLYLDASANMFSMEVSWIQPVTNKEVEIYSYGPEYIIQKDPLVNVNQITNKVEEKGNGKIQIITNDVKIIPPNDGGGEGSVANISVDVIGSFEGGLEGKAVFLNEPEIRELPDGTYEIEAMIQINVAEIEKKIEGDVIFNVQATAINSVNSQASKLVQRQAVVPITYEVLPWLDIIDK